MVFQSRATLLVRCKHNAAWEQQQLTRAPRIHLFLIIFKPLPTTNINNIFWEFVTDFHRFYLKKT